MILARFGLALWAFNALLAYSRLGDTVQIVLCSVGLAAGLFSVFASLVED